MRTYKWIIASAVAVALAGCGSDEISSAGSSGNITINNPPAQNPDPGPNPDPDPGSGGVQPAAGCPTIANPIPLTNSGTIEGPTGTYRVCDLPARFTASSTLPRVPGLLYALHDRVDVGTDLGPTPTAGEASVTLTIEPGVVLFGKAGTSWLAVNRGNRIQAVGTAEQPIVFTSRDNVLGLATDDSQGQWGGVVLMGRAPITDCRTGTPGAVDCDRQTEGSAALALYGGATPTDSSGRMSYVQIRYSGYVLGANSELQALTLEGVGSGTIIDHIQMHNSSDDGFENFGGRVHMRHIVVTGADDDSIDLDTGYKGTIQYLIAVQKTSGAADSIIELDSTNANESQTPRTHMKVANFTFVHRNPGTANTAAMLFRGGADVTMVNGVLTSPMACLRLNGANILATDPAIDKVGPPVFHSVVMSCGTTPTVDGSGVTAQQALDLFAAGTNNNTTFSPTLTGTFINGANETAAVAVNPQTIDPEFDALTTPYIGAVRDANDTWYAGWTCNSATASFGSASTACTTLPSLAQ
ncbi:hypothetical protein JM946_09790 [Steroidobacter sp. S1-65]|uniref:Secreted protein n=1 Tax=Steroidobacter gossypii TaxID=2805490 RepID=A0ABS1WVN8_9GAMM|nr:hypothetical protein [Steroidobacter gossypii]MBM0105042.1 hypothetical protein [Steroidobacter gossypii]